MRKRSEIEEELKHIPSDETELIIIELLLDIRHLVSVGTLIYPSEDV